MHRTVRCELIDTLWNVNKDMFKTVDADNGELIDTLWNVNRNKKQRRIRHSYELIDTLWNVNCILLQP